MLNSIPTFLALHRGSGESVEVTTQTHAHTHTRTQYSSLGRETLSYLSCGCKEGRCRRRNMLSSRTPVCFCLGQRMEVSEASLYPTPFTTQDARVTSKSTCVCLQRCPEKGFYLLMESLIRGLKQNKSHLTVGSECLMWKHSIEFASMEGTLRSIHLQERINWLTGV